MARSPYSITVLRGRLYVNRKPSTSLLDVEDGTFVIVRELLTTRPDRAARRCFDAGYVAGQESIIRDRRSILPILGDVS